MYLCSSRHPTGSALFARFEEEHSHASSHLLHLPQDAPTREMMLNARSLVLVDEVDGIHNIAEDEISSASLSGEHASAKYTRGVLQWKTRSLRLLDEEQLLSAITRSLT